MLTERGPPAKLPSETEAFYQFDASVTELTGGKDLKGRLEVLGWELSSQEQTMFFDDTMLSSYFYFVHSNGVNVLSPEMQRVMSVEYFQHFNDCKIINGLLNEIPKAYAVPKMREKLRELETKYSLEGYSREESLPAWADDTHMSLNAPYVVAPSAQETLLVDVAKRWDKMQAVWKYKRTIEVEVDGETRKKDEEVEVNVVREVKSELRRVRDECWGRGEVIPPAL